MDILSLAKDIGDQHYASLKADPPALPVRQSPLMRIQDELQWLDADSGARRRINGAIMEIEAAAYLRGVQDGKVSDERV